MPKRRRPLKGGWEFDPAENAYMPQEGKVRTALRNARDKVRGVKTTVSRGAKGAAAGAVAGAVVGAPAAGAAAGGVLGPTIGRIYDYAADKFNKAKAYVKERRERGPRARKVREAIDGPPARSISGMHGRVDHPRATDAQRRDPGQAFRKRTGIFGMGKKRRRMRGRGPDWTGYHKVPGVQMPWGGDVYAED